MRLNYILVYRSNRNGYTYRTNKRSRINHWRNIYPNYLEGFLEKNIDLQKQIPEDQMQDFLKIGYFNLENAD